MVRNRYVVAYDVMDPQRLVKTYKKMLGYGDRIQYSVFSCSLSLRELVMMRADLEEILNLNEDRMIIINIGSSNTPIEKNVITIGTQLDLREDSAVVV